MGVRSQRVILSVLAASGFYVGLWGLASPHAFYRSFPGFGRHWTAVDGPYNEHLVRDVAAFYTALAVLAVVAYLRADRGLRWTAGLTWVVFSVPHLAYHASHLDMLGTFDKVAEMASLGATLVLAALLLLPTRTRET